jgi:N-acetylmuramic acid 6-phosphate etherase
MPSRRSAHLLKDTRLTEKRNPLSGRLDRMTALEIVRLMNHEDRKVPRAIERELPKIARAVDAIVNRLQSRGRLFYIGAGSSGRMGVLDAAECAPTFGTPRTLVQGLIAGGRRAFTTAVEGAEDATANARRDLAAKNLRANDVVVGITASGTTPFVLAALTYARQRGAATIAITANRNTPLVRVAEIVIAPNVGPEVLTGSTRLKAGTAQKMVLNMLSTAAMVQLGHAYDNLMIDAVLTNAKLEHRSLRILADASGKSVSAARHALRQSGHNMRIALVMLKHGITASEAKKRLRRAKRNLRQALGE